MTVKTLIEKLSHYNDNRAWQYPLTDDVNLEITFVYIFQNFLKISSFSNHFCI